MKDRIFQKKDRTKQIVCVIIGICISIVMTGMIVKNRAEYVNAKAAEVQEKLAEEVFRFHVLADSDREEDQEVKLAVRDAVISFMKEDMGDEMSADETKLWAQEHLKELEETADKELEERGFDYRAKAEVTNCYFPEKRYGDVVFPEGKYEALRIRLGKAEGHNWWCVLYPNLCFMDTTCAVVSEKGKEELKEALEEDEYEMITAMSDFKIKWFFFGNDTEEE